MKKILVPSLAFALFISISVTGMAETAGFKKYQLMPKDDASSDKDFSPFIKKFKKDIQNKNTGALKTSIAADIQWSFGDENGIKSFIKFWKLDKNAKSSEFWNEMDNVLSMGSAFYDEKKTSHAYPYLFVTFPGDYDIYEYAAVTAKKVNVRKAPSSKAPVVETLDFEIVKMINVTPDAKQEKIDGVTGRWLEVMTSGGKTGYIFSRYMHSPIGYRAIFEKRGKAWVLTAFISGD